MFCKKNIALLLMLSSLFMIQIVSGQNKSPIMYFPMDERAGELVLDQNGKMGVIQAAEWTEGKFGSALRFDGKNSYVEIDAANELGSNELTLSAWIKPETFQVTESAKPVLLCHGYYKKNGWYVQLEPTGGIQVVLNKNNTLTTVTTLTGLQLNRWHHVAVTMIRNNGLKIYIDGEKISEKQSKMIDWLPASAPLYIGKYKNRRFEYKGSIDEIKIFDKALEPEEIKRLISSPPDIASKQNNPACICKTSLPPRIDGEVKNDIWSTVPVTAANFRVKGKNEKADKQTAVWILYDKENIYFCCYLIEPDIDKILTNHINRDSAVWQDDSIEIFLDVNNDKKSYYHFVCNAKGVQADEYNPSKDEKNLAWNGKWQAAAKVGKNCWFAEIAIPFKTLGLKAAPDSGTCWGISLNRSETQKKEYSGWPDGYFHAPEQFGKIIFGGSVRRGERETPFKNNLQAKLSGLKRNIDAFKKSHIISDDDPQLRPYVATKLRETSEQAAALEKYLSKLREKEDLTSGKWSELDRTIIQLSSQLNGIEVRLEAANLYRQIKENSHRNPKEEENISKSLAGVTAKAGGDNIPAADKKYFEGIKRKIYRTFFPQPYLLWKKNPWENLAPAQLPLLTAKAPQAVNLFMALNEYRNESLAITNFTEDEMVFTVTVKDKEIPVTIRECYPIPASGKYVNDALPLLETLKIPAFQSREVWLNVNSKNLKAGKYEADLLIESGKIKHEVKLNLKVYPVKLPDCDKNFPLYTFVWDYLDGKTPELQQAAIEDLRNHYITVPYFGAGSVPWPDFDKDGKMNIDFSKCDDAIRIWQDKPYKMLGWYWHFLKNNPNITRFGKTFMSNEWKKRFSAWLPEFVAHLKGKGLTYDDFYFHIFDETTCDDLKETAKLVKQIDPRIKIFSDPIQITSPTTEEIKGLSPYIDIWAPYLWRFIYRAEDLKTMSSKGEYYWNYANPDPKPLFSTCKYRLMPWYTRKLGMHGCGYWVYLVSSPQMMWNKFEKVKWNVVYLSEYAPPGVSKKELIIPGKRWEAWREGVADYLYLNVLEQLLKGAQANGIDPKLIESGQRLIKEEVERVTGDADNEETADAARQKILDEIMKLKAALLMKRGGSPN
ncbi:MAG: sugar-binding protein [Victivallaceae bacterium]|nr:sugar-binding protein [Victivallaceae bacterium]